MSLTYWCVQEGGPPKLHEGRSCCTWDPSRLHCLYLDPSIHLYSLLYNTLVNISVSLCWVSFSSKWLNLRSKVIRTSNLWPKWTEVVDNLRTSYLQLLFKVGSSLVREKAKAPHSSPLAWKIPWTEEPGRLQSMGSLRVGHYWATSLSLLCIGEGNGNPLQCSCLENPRDRGAWWAAVSGVAQSRTRLKRLSSSSSLVRVRP